MRGYYIQFQASPTLSRRFSKKLNLSPQYFQVTETSIAWIKQTPIMF